MTERTLSDKFLGIRVRSRCFIRKVLTILSLLHVVALKIGCAELYDEGRARCIVLIFSSMNEMYGLIAGELFVIDGTCSVVAPEACIGLFELSQGNRR